MRVFRISLALAVAASLVAAVETSAQDATAESTIDRHASELLAQPIESRARLTIVFILDGLRPDSINRVDTPNLYSLRSRGVNFENGHAVFPTVTRVNAPSKVGD